VRLIRRIQALLSFFEGKTVAEIVEVLGVSGQTIYNYLNTFILNRLDSLVYKRPPGRAPKLSKTQKKVLAKLIDRGPQAAGYDCGCWDTTLIQDLILTRFGREYSVHYVAELLKNMGFSYQKARFVSDHLAEVAPRQKQWMEIIWPYLLRFAEELGAMVLFGDEASFAQWGSLSYTWAPKGQQPEVPTSGKRKGYKIFGLIDYFSGQFFYKSQTGRFNSESYAAFLLDVLSQTKKQVIVIQDGARYHTSKAMQQFFEAHAARLTIEQLPAYSPDFNPIEHLWKNVKKEATHLKYFPEFTDLQQEVDRALLHFAQTPREITVLMARYCEKLGQVDKAA
jgi:transposase